MRMGWKSNTVAAVFAGMTLAAAACMLWLRQRDLGIPIWIPTCVASTSFLLTAIARGAGGRRMGRLMLLGLAFCWLGDMIGPLDFMAGVGAFLAAHLAFIAAFTVRGFRWSLVRRDAVLVFAISGVIACWLLPHVPADQLLLVTAYLIVISIMWMGAGGTAYDWPGRLILVGATIFYVSDIFVARWRYVDTSTVNAFFCYPLYYLACVILAWSSGFEKHLQHSVKEG